MDVTQPGAAPYEVAVTGTALDPRPDPAGKRLAYVSAGALRVASLGGGAGRRKEAGTRCWRTRGARRA